MSSTLNFNVGLLGHVDSGKTTLSRSLSTLASTAAFDKNPQSRERGITLDLGFSSFAVEPAPEHLAKGAGQESSFDRVQYTLVDCPGHASLIRTIIGGAQIVDLMLLIVDCTKGLQTQTAECLVLGEIVCRKMMVVLTKVDCVAEDKRKAHVEKMKKRMRLTLGQTRFRDAPIVAVSAAVGATAEGRSMTPATTQDEEGQATTIGMDALIEEIKSMTDIPQRSSEGPLLFSVDHCFSIRGQGTVMTGTILQGSVHVNDTVEIVSLKECRKVKSLQMFKQSVPSASQGDRLGLCVTQFDSKLLERGLVCTPGTVPVVYAGIVQQLEKIKYFKGDLANRAKFHVSVGHETVLARITLFRGGDGGDGDGDDGQEFSLDRQYKFVESWSEMEEEEKEKEGEKRKRPSMFALLEFERPVPVCPNSKVLGSKLDTDSSSSSCRLAFHGTMSHLLESKDYSIQDLPHLHVYKEKQKTGSAERANSEQEVICKGMFKKETNLALFRGLRVQLSTGERGTIEDSFGQSGKFKVRVPEGLKPSTFEALRGSKKKKGESSSSSSNAEPITLSLRFKRYIFNKKMTQ